MRSSVKILSMNRGVELVGGFSERKGGERGEVDRDVQTEMQSLG